MADSNTMTEESESDGRLDDRGKEHDYCQVCHQLIRVGGPCTTCDLAGPWSSKPDSGEQP